MSNFEHYIMITRDAFADYAWWKTICEQVGADPDETYAVGIFFGDNQIRINEDA